MKSLILALALINAPVEEQYEMLADLYDADPRLAYEVLDVAADVLDVAAERSMKPIRLDLGIADSNGGEEYIGGYVAGSGTIYDSTKASVIGLMFDPCKGDIGQQIQFVSEDPNDPIVEYHRGF